MGSSRGTNLGQRDAGKLSGDVRLRSLAGQCNWMLQKRVELERRHKVSRVLCAMPTSGYDVVRPGRKKDTGDLCQTRDTPAEEPGTSTVTGGPLLEERKSATLDTILQATAAVREALELKINTTVTDLVLLQDDHRRLTERVTSPE
ncbi:hypothetical protein NDU88_001092 [Pleurodeles waltl]|uniref:Uncharacterized protein n=1 Tax=Pleurodeles waltl TaxID=8319 RepID=A0AAV7MIS1_PLEWA|nr:hypothetical protein NDU88_001092 [Pleurodeles waltl]